MEFSFINKANFDKDCSIYNANSEFYHNNNANGGLSSVANHMNHYNLMIDSSSYKLCANETAMRGSLNQESSLLFSKITTVSEFYPGTHNIASYNSGRIYILCLNIIGGATEIIRKSLEKVF